MRLQFVLVLNAFICAAMMTTVKAADVTTSPLPAQSAEQAQPLVQPVAHPQGESETQTSDAPIDAVVQRGSVKREFEGMVQRSANAAAKVPRSSLPADRLDLETTVVTGNRELPKVLYIVPWKKAELGELPAQPFNTLLDEVLAPIDRDVFKREVKYFHAVDGAGQSNGKPSAVPATSVTTTPDSVSGQGSKN